MSLEGDARSERQSSADAAPLAAVLMAARRFARPGFALSLLLHLAVQAYRAHTDADRPEPGLELEPWFVAGALLVVFVSLGLLAPQTLHRPTPNVLPARPEQARALAVAEQLSLLGVALFAVLHVAETAWPLLSGELVASDLRPELVLLLSTTSHGVPMHAAGYLCGVGAATFYATRQALRSFGDGRATIARAIVLLGVLAYLLGSYAVIRCASGAILS